MNEPAVKLYVKSELLSIRLSDPRRGYCVKNCRSGPIGQPVVEAAGGAWGRRHKMRIRAEGRGYQLGFARPAALRGVERSVVGAEVDRDGGPGCLAQGGAHRPLVAEALGEEAAF